MASSFPLNVAADGSVVSWKNLEVEEGVIVKREFPPANPDTKRQMEYLQKILGSNVYDVAIETPLQLAPLLSTRMGVNLWVKREDAQQVTTIHHSK